MLLKGAVSCSNPKLHQTLEVKNILKQEHIALQLKFTPGLTLTGFRTTRPWVGYEQTSCEGRSKKVVGAHREPVRGLTPGWREAL